MKASEIANEIEYLQPLKWFGKVTRVVGLTIEARGPQAAVGDICLIYPTNERDPLQAEVVGFKESLLLLMPFSPTAHIQPGSLVKSTGKPLTIGVGTGLIGKVIDGLGHPLDGGERPKGLYKTSVERSPPNPLTRPRITRPLSLGVRAVDGLLTVGEGQRVGIFAGSGVGKSTLMAMFTKYSEADINVIALIGERGREVKDFIDKDLGDEGRKNTIVVVATSDQPALVRIKGAMAATAIAEYFRDQGKRVNLMMDSITRFAMAQREIGLAIGEPPTTKGYTPSVFALLPRLLERSGTSEYGSITAFYTVLVDGDDLDEPIADAVRGILDGHFILDRKLANKGHYPALNILKSVSRLLPDIVSEEHGAAASVLRQHLATYEENEDLIQVGAYKRGTSKDIDLALDLQPDIQAFLQQGTDKPLNFTKTTEQLQILAGKGNDGR
ncbi:flagellar protein export ATPase FliI [Natribacillus halophilus]|uniref:Type III secretion system ATPase, FliI/YscN n=1 Tax=Natribacillus halophilus TaxID=549003 RepID=A0A1G8PNH7_9BACI|nr:flagellar protein export ATPase FliI [Natribacillus halophilus]SDI93866.1 type III secretion system ATPase, FliI/YscN [Natribacillus halophilus]